jgi:N-methylhydantoinase A
MKKSMIRVATDVGGTFTDLVCFETDTETGKHSIVTAKTDTTPPDFETGVLNVLTKGQVDPSEVDFLDSWHRALIGIVTISGSSAENDARLSKNRGFYIL